MIEVQLIGRHISTFADVLGAPVLIPARPPEGDPEYLLSRYVVLPERGVAIVIDWDDIANCVQFYSAEKDARYAEYRGDLPCGLSFRSARQEVRNALGNPAECNDGGKLLPVLGRMRPWDWFVFDGHKLHFEYRENCDGVLMVSFALLPSGFSA